MNWYKFLTVKQIKYIMMREHLIEYPCFSWYWESRARLFKTVDKVICWINHLSSGQLLLFKSCPLDKCALSWTTFVKFNWVRIKFYPVDKYDRQLKLHSNFFFCYHEVFLYLITRIAFPFFGNRLYYT
jgi:hypothetical protein